MFNELLDVSTGILANELRDKRPKKLGIRRSLFLIYSQYKTERSKIYISLKENLHLKCTTKLFTNENY